MSHESDGSAGDADYGRIGPGYNRFRRPEPEIAYAVDLALGDARTVVNIGAGAGSYEPRDRMVTAVEPSATMRSQRPSELAPAVDASAERLPFANNAFDAAMATFSVHQWADLDAGLQEMRRVATGPVVILTCDPSLLSNFWLADYAPEAIAVEARRYPPLDRITRALGGTTTCVNVPIPNGCLDGFGEAYYGRPEALLDPGARTANSAWSFVEDSIHTRFEKSLRSDLDSGKWDRHHGHLRTQSHFRGSLVLITNVPRSQ